MQLGDLLLKLAIHVITIALTLIRDPNIPQTSSGSVLRCPATAAPSSHSIGHVYPVIARGHEKRSSRPASKFRATGAPQQPKHSWMLSCSGRSCHNPAFRLLQESAYNLRYSSRLSSLKERLAWAARLCSSAHYPQISFIKKMKRRMYLVQR